MLCNQTNTPPRAFFYIFVWLVLTLACRPGILLAQVYQYTEAGRADSTPNGDRLAITQSQLVIGLPAARQLDPDKSLTWQPSYTPLQQDIAKPLHNGHLHYSRIHWQASEHRAKRWQHQWSLGLAMSSNRFKDAKPAKDGVVLEGSTFRVLSLGKSLSGLVGVQANYLFNRYRVLPDVGLQWQSPVGNVALSTQRASWTYDVSGSQRISILVARAASKWLVQDNDSGRQSQVYLRKNLAGISYEFNIASAWAMRLGLGYTQVRRLDFQQASTGPTRMKFDGAPTMSLGLTKF